MAGLPYLLCSAGYGRRIPKDWARSWPDAASAEAVRFTATRSSARPVTPAATTSNTSTLIAAPSSLPPSMASRPGSTSADSTARTALEPSEMWLYWANQPQDDPIIIRV
jgi:hypothetical protein